jgi:cyclohexa-1,5-dienecarbonyl-CoA hydratase
MTVQPDAGGGSPVHIAFDAGRTRASIRLFHPKGNIVTAAMIRALGEALDDLAGEPRLTLLTIEGVGHDFSFGASIPEHAPGAIEHVLPQAHALIERLIDLPCVTAALVRGRCLGGGFEIALACDFIFAEQSAVFGLPEIALGVFPPAASVLLPARVGTARASGALLTGATSTAAEWHAAGLVAVMSADGHLAGDVDRWFEATLAPRSAEALRYAVVAARSLLRQSVRTQLPALERLYLDDLMKSEDAREGVAAFLAKRRPEWNHR